MKREPVSTSPPSTSPLADSTLDTIARPIRATEHHRQGCVVAISSQPPTRTRAHLGRVTGLLADVLADLDRLWRAELDDQGNVDVLGERDLPDLLQQVLHSGGKRIRPVMSYLGWLSAGGHRTGFGEVDVVRAGAALEMLHAFALIHDDVMDESDSRRGRPSIHAQAAMLHQTQGASGSAQRFGESIAVLVGDLAHTEADELAASLPPEMRKIWRLLTLELVCGQRRDLTGSAASRRDLGHARQVARMKSGCYTVLRPLQLGATAAHAPEPVMASLSRYGCAVGEAFALRDDLLGVWGDPEVTGKPAGDDLMSGKPTVILSLAGERLTGPARQALGRIGTGDLDWQDLLILRQAMDDCGVITAVEEQIATHLHNAIEALDDDVLTAEGIAGLIQLAHQIAWRDR